MGVKLRPFHAPARHKTRRGRKNGVQPSTPPRFNLLRQPTDPQYEPMVQLFQLPERDPHPRPLFFTRGELSEMLSVYSRRVMSGEWRDYAIDHRDGLATFSIFRHTLDRPLFAIVKAPGSGDPRSEYILMQGPERLARSASLAEILTALEGRPRLVES